MSRFTTQKLSPEDMAVLEGLRTRIMPLRYNIENLHNEVMREQGNPPSWPEIQRAIAILNSHIFSLQQYINGYESETTDKQGRVTTKIVPGQHALLRQLHPYPMPPLPIEQNGMTGIVETLLRKRMNPKEEEWVNECLRKASEFCHVPEDWGIEPKKDGDGDGDEDDDEDEVGNHKFKKVERRSGLLTEDEMMGMWADANNQAKIAAAKMADENLEAEEEGSGSETSSLEEEETEDKIMKDEDGEGGAGVGAGGQATQPALPLSAVLRFMSTGSAM